MLFKLSDKKNTKNTNNTDISIKFLVLNVKKYIKKIKDKVTIISGNLYLVEFSNFFLI
jgi:hypothetical protein